MSGSSLDGLDLAFCNFVLEEGLEALSWELIAADTFPFSPQCVSRLHHLAQQDALTFAKTHAYFGHYLAELSQQFLYKHQLKPDFIASHGHTIFHYPDQRLSVQVGDGASLAVLTGLPVVSDFRTQDVAIDGDGAPLAPLADYYLFRGYDYYLNLGGIANISALNGQRPVAFDVGPANQVLNALAQLRERPYDDAGARARRGTVQEDLLESVDALPYFGQVYPKSLDNNWVRQRVLPLYLQHPASPEDKLRTACEQLARQVRRAIALIGQQEKLPLRPEVPTSSLYLTGGGAFNHFLVERIDQLCEPLGVSSIIPSEKIIQFKEAILIALLGVLRMERKVNCWSSVTGAKRNTIGGSVYWA